MMSVRGVLCCRCATRKLSKNDFPLPVAPRTSGMPDVADVEVQVIRRVLRCVHDRQRLPLQMALRGAPLSCANEQGEIRRIRVEQMHGPHVVCGVTGERGEPRIQQVIALVGDLRVVRRERFQTRADAAFERGLVGIRHDDGQRYWPNFTGPWSVSSVMRDPRSRTTAAALSSTSTSVGEGFHHITGHADLGVVEVAPFRMNLAADRPLPFPLPFRSR